jgi:hypothetical protein
LASTQTKLSQLSQKNNADATDQVVMYSNVSSNDVIVAVSNLYTNTLLMANQLIIMQNSTPANSSANVTPYTLWSDGSYIYYATSANSITRVALSSF